MTSSLISSRQAPGKATAQKATDLHAQASPDFAAKLAEAEAAAHAAAQVAAAEADQSADQEIEIEEGETLEEVKARMASLKPKKQSISADLLNTANSYDDKVALIRMIVAEDSTRVAGVLKSLIQ